MIREFLMPRNGKTATIDILGPSHLAQVLALQDETRRALPEAEKMFVLPQKPAYFEALLDRQNGLMIGVHHKGQMIAQMAVMGALTLEEAVMRNAITRNEIPFHHAEQDDLIVVAKSMAVHPLWRGNDLSQHMLEAALELPFARATDHVFAQISVDNVRSWELFLRCGFGIVAAAIDPGDQKPRFIVQKPALGFSLHSTASVVDVDPVDDFTAVMRLTGIEALIGQKADAGPAQLMFYADIDRATAWSDESASLA